MIIFISVIIIIHSFIGIIIIIIHSSTLNALVVRTPHVRTQVKTRSIVILSTDILRLRVEDNVCKMNLLSTVVVSQTSLKTTLYLNVVLRTAIIVSNHRYRV